MRTLSPLENPKGILAFDFDGTMHWDESEPGVDPRLIEWIKFLREKHGMAWGICTGRSMMHLLEGITQSLPFLPDFAITREREIYVPNNFGRFVPDEAWNKACDKAHKRLFKKSRKELKAVRAYVEEVAKGEWIQVEGDLAGVVLPDIKEMDGLLAEVKKRCADCSELGYERNSIYLRFSHTAYGKGPGLLEMMRRMGLSPDEVVACGDNYNDFSMLTPEVSTRPVCPGNAVAEVKQRVMDCGGIVGSSIASKGLVEAFEQLFPSS